MELKKLIYVTSNQRKFEEAKLILNDYSLVRKDLELPELQGDAQSIIRAKAFSALERLNEALIVEDVAVYCPALSGLPGPYVKDFLKAMGEQGLYEIVQRLGDPRAEVACCAGYIKPGSEPQVFEGRLKGKLVAPQGESRFGKYSWNPIFVPDGYTCTFGQMALEEQSKISMRRMALEQLRIFLASQGEGW